MWVRKRLDIGWRDLAYGAAQCALSISPRKWARRVESLCSADDEALCCLSVRSGWDLLLAALQLPRGSEVLVSALTIPDMVRIIEAHGLVAVPVDIDVHRLEVDFDHLERARTPASKVLLVAHLFGSRADSGALAAFARRHGLLLVEDCAQAFVGPDGLRQPRTGDDRADVEMYSFGTIKTATALGGAVLVVRDRQLLVRMRQVHAEYPHQSRAAYLRRVLKYAGLKAISSRWGYRMFIRVCALLGTSHDHVIAGTVRGFAGPGFFTRIRRQPAAPLLALLHRRLLRFDRRALAARTQRGELLRRLLTNIEIPGRQAQCHTYWVFSILVDAAACHDESVVPRLWQLGFDVTRSQSLRVVEPPAGREHLAARVAQRIVEQMLVLPCYAEMPEGELQRLATALTNALPALQAGGGAPRSLSTPLASAASR